MRTHRHVRSFFCGGMVLTLLAFGVYCRVTEESLAAQDRLAAGGIPEAGVRQWSLGYWTPWGNPHIPPDRIEWGALTHVVYAWALVQPDGRLDLKTQELPTHARRLVSEAGKHDVQVLLGIGQSYWTGQTSNLPEAARKHRSRLVNAIMDVVNRYDFDGVDIDWEPFNAREDGESLKSLAEALRDRLGSRALSAAAIVTDYRFWGEAHRPFDRVGVMTYDLTGTWNPYSWHNAALYGRGGPAEFSILRSLSAQVWSIDLAVQRFTQAGVPASKLSIGLPFFGYEWSGGGITGPGQRWDRNPDIRKLSFQALEGRVNTAVYRWDSDARVPYISFNRSANGNDRFLTYDNEQSIAEKVRYAKNKDLGGWIIWELSGDYFPARRPSQPLLNAVKNAK